jgi:hypothetical protein
VIKILKSSRNYEPGKENSLKSNKIIYNSKCQVFLRKQWVIKKTEIESLEILGL